MFETAYLKITRASKHIDDLSELMRDKRLFYLVIQTDSYKQSQTVFVKNNDTVISQAALIVGDAVHNLRCALDHAYWQLVSPHVKDVKLQTKIQFPFYKSEQRFIKELEKGFGYLLSDKMIKNIRYLRPYPDSAGENFLYLIHEMDIVDKHRLLIPTTGYTGFFPGKLLSHKFSDFPGRIGANIMMHSSGSRISWPMNRHQRLLASLLGVNYFLIEQEIDAKVEACVSVGPQRSPLPMIPTLHKLVDVARATIQHLGS